MNRFYAFCLLIIFVCLTISSVKVLVDMNDKNMVDYRSTAISKGYHERHGKCSPYHYVLFNVNGKQIQNTYDDLAWEQIVVGNDYMLRINKTEFVRATPLENAKVVGCIIVMIMGVFASLCCFAGVIVGDDF